MSENPSGLITEASSGIGAAYANRFARRGHSLMLVARQRDKERLEVKAARFRKEIRVAVDVLQATSPCPSNLRRWESDCATTAGSGSGEQR